MPYDNYWGSNDDDDNDNDEYQNEDRIKIESSPWISILRSDS